MLSLLSLTSAEICWQLEVDMGMAALLVVGCLSLGCLFQSKLEIRQVFLRWKDEMFFFPSTCACQCEACRPLLLLNCCRALCLKNEI